MFRKRVRPIIFLSRMGSDTFALNSSLSHNGSTFKKERSDAISSGLFTKGEPVSAHLCVALTLQLRDETFL